MRTYVVEFIQTDPVGSRTPGLAHFAGEARCTSRDEALAVAIASLGRPVSSTWFHPCCDWQLQTTPVTGCHVEVEENGVDIGGWEVRLRHEA